MVAGTDGAVQQAAPFSEDKSPTRLLSSDEPSGHRNNSPTAGRGQHNRPLLGLERPFVVLRSGGDQAVSGSPDPGRCHSGPPRRLTSQIKSDDSAYPWGEVSLPQIGGFYTNRLGVRLLLEGARRKEWERGRRPQRSPDFSSRPRRFRSRRPATGGRDVPKPTAANRTAGRYPEQKPAFSEGSRCPFHT